MVSRLLYGSIIIGILCSVCSCSESRIPGEDRLFREVSDEWSGVSFSNQLEESEDFNIIDYLYFYNGGGVCVGDINNDGLEDIYLSANRGPNKLYLNRGKFQFQDITEEAGVSSPGMWKTGVTMADVNGDGWLDIYVCRLGNYKGIAGHNELYINNGDLTFTESAADYKLDFSGFSTQAAFFDFDNDHDLDIYLLNHSVHTSRSYGKSELRLERDSLGGDRLYRNDGNSFADVTKSAGIYSSQIGYGLGVGLSDINMDGFTDIYVSNDFHENDYLYINQGDGTFRESMREYLTYTSRFSMGNDIADINNDGHPDIMTTDMLPEDEIVLKKSAGEDSYEIYELKLRFGYARQSSRNMLQINNGDGTFSEVAHYFGVAATDWSWSPLIVDFDLDGYKDLFISNGIVRRPNDLDYIKFISNKSMQDPNTPDSLLINQMPEGKAVNYFFKNNNGQSYSEVTNIWTTSDPGYSTAAAYSDLDNDGDFDLIINNINSPVTLLENTLENKGHHVKAKLEGPPGNMNGLGSKITLFYNGEAQFYEVFNTHGFQSGSTSAAIFGIDSAATSVRCRVDWPGGRVSLIDELLIDTINIISHKTSQIDTEKLDQQPPYFQKAKMLAWKHTENGFVDFSREFLLPAALSRDGPSMAVADVNGDGMEDFYVGGSAGVPGTLFMQKPDGSFRESDVPEFAVQKFSEESVVLFFDADGDQDPDLYVGTGGHEFSGEDSRLLDYLYINDNGNYKLAKGAIPPFYQNAGVVTAADIDLDGDIDLFVGGRSISGNYGLTPKSYILTNNGSGRFEVSSMDEELEGRIGMVTDAVFSDISGNGFPDLLIVGEWMPVKIYFNEEPGFSSDPKIIKHSEGWWNTIHAVDLDKDGDTDFILGNQGENSRLKLGENGPLKMYVTDFDKNGQLDQIITYFIDGVEVTIASKDELQRQMPGIKKRFPNYSDFAGKSVSEIFGMEALNSGSQFEVNTFKSSILRNDGNGQFTMLSLPSRAQYTPIHAIATMDVDTDGLEDLILGGNEIWSSTYFGSQEAGHGFLLINKGENEFEYVAQAVAGLSIRGDIRSLQILKQLNQKELLLVGVNDDSLRLYRSAQH